MRHKMKSKVWGNLSYAFNDSVEWRLEVVHDTSDDKLWLCGETKSQRQSFTIQITDEVRHMLLKGILDFKANRKKDLQTRG